MEENNIINYKSLESPGYFKKNYPISNKAKETVINARESIKKILNGEDSRRVFIIGPCSIHNYEETLEYAKKLKEISEKVKNKILILMRVYLEKPRTTPGWKGFINDPDLNSSFDISKGLSLSRKLLIKINELGLPVAVEFLDVLVYPYVYDLISWGAIGARTTESQTHRQVVSGFSIPIGFKNSTSGSIETAINAIKSANSSHHFIGINDEGKVSVVNTKGNLNAHLILRGGDNGPNYEEEFVKEAIDRLSEEGLMKKILIDCSHGNSLSDYKRQAEVFKDVVFQMKDNPELFGLMFESYLNEGSQEIPKNSSELKPGISVTDTCISMKDTEKLVMDAYGVV